MCASYPGDIYEPREKANAAGIVFDADNKTRIYVEDVTGLDDEVIAIEEELGEDPKGDDADVTARLDRIDGDKLEWTSQGDIAAADFTKADLTLDASWHDLDLSDKIPAGTKLVLMQVVVSTTAAGKSIYFRKKGNANAYNLAEARAVTTAAYNTYDLWAEPDEDGILEYKAVVATWNLCSIMIRGTLK